MKLDFYCPNFKAVSFQVMYNGSDKYYVIQVGTSRFKYLWYKSVICYVIP